MKRIIFLALSVLSFSALFNSCQKELSVENTDKFNTAKGSLKDTSGNCLPSIVHGTFYTGITPGSDTAYVEIQVNVDSIGTYSITTDFQNGFMFADSGLFNTTGINTIRLKPAGTPILQVPTNFVVIFDTSVCSFTVSVQDSTGTGLGGDTVTVPPPDTTAFAWQLLVANTQFFKGTIEAATLIDTLGLSYLTIFGPTATTGDTVFLLSIPFLNGEIAPGTYSTAGGGAAFYLSDFNTTQPIYSADPTTTAVDISITITSFDNTTNTVTGVLSGTVTDGQGRTIKISNGWFRAQVT